MRSPGGAGGGHGSGGVGPSGSTGSKRRACRRPARCPHRAQLGRARAPVALQSCRSTSPTRTAPAAAAAAGAAATVAATNIADVPADCPPPPPPNPPTGSRRSRRCCHFSQPPPRCCHTRCPRRSISLQHVRHCRPPRLGEREARPSTGLRSASASAAGSRVDGEKDAF